MNGKWHFSDKPISDAQKTAAKKGVKKPSYGSPQVVKKDKQGSVKNLSDALEQRFQPRNAIERVTLAVVSVETALGVGSGFFISDDGFILTNKHVIRPTGSSHWQEAKAKLDKMKETLRQRADWLKKEDQRLVTMETDLSN